MFFLAEEGANCSLTPAKPHIDYTPRREPFEKGLGQKFKQQPGTGVMLALFDDEELMKGGEDNMFPLVIRMETVPRSPPPDAPPRDSEPLGAALPDWVHSQITQAVIEKKDDETYQVRVVKQIIWVGGTRYELQEIYGIENSGGGGNFDGTDAGKECVVCMSEPRDTTVLPCRHMVRHFLHFHMPLRIFRNAVFHLFTHLEQLRLYPLLLSQKLEAEITHNTILYCT